jgi:hypothetical protein
MVSQVAKLITFHILVGSKMVALKYPLQPHEKCVFAERPENPSPASHFKLN